MVVVEARCIMLYENHSVAAHSLATARRNPLGSSAEATSIIAPGEPPPTSSCTEHGTAARKPGRVSGSVDVASGRLVARPTNDYLPSRVISLS